jgi:FG-GAP-like repeat
MNKSRRMTVILASAVTIAAAFSMASSHYGSTRNLSLVATSYLATTSYSSTTSRSAKNGSSVTNDELVIPVGKGPGAVVLADVNHDGKLDLLLANVESETLSVLLGDGKGHFVAAPGTACATGKAPNDIAVGDFNGDGNLDLVIANTGTPNLTILLGDGKGGFKASARSPFVAASHPHVHGVAVGDFNGDGKLDVVTDSWGNNQILMLTGDGAGNLNGSGRAFDVGKRPYERLRVADFNKDGIPDVVTTDLDQNAVTILLGDGHGGFREAGGSPFAAGMAPWAVAIDDVNKDGNLDLVVIPYAPDVKDPSRFGMTVLLGDGKGGFRTMSGSPFSLAGCGGPQLVAVGDLNGDGLRDVVVSCAQSNSLVIFMGTRTGGFQIVSRQLKDIGWSGLAVGDLNGDGKDDVVVTNNGSGMVTVLFGKE